MSLPFPPPVRGESWALQQPTNQVQEWKMTISIPFLRTDCVGLSFSFKGHSNHNRYVLQAKKNSRKWRLFIKTICGKLFLSVTPLHQTCSSNWNPMERLVCQSQPAGLLFKIPVECVFSEHIKGIHDSFLQLSGGAVPFYGSCPGCYSFSTMWAHFVPSIPSCHFQTRQPDHLGSFPDEHFREKTL